MKVLLALHGFLGRPSDWADLFAPLKSTGAFDQLVAVDYMNEPGLGPDQSLSEWGHSFLQWAQRRWPQAEKTLMGYSLGGRLALHAVEAEPSAWAHALFLSTNPGLISNDDRRLRLKADAEWARAFEFEPFKEVVQRWNSQEVFKYDEQPPARQEKDYCRQQLAKVLIQWSLAHQKDFRSLVGGWSLPQDWLAGELDLKYVDLLQLLPLTPHINKKIVAKAAHRGSFVETLFRILCKIPSIS